VSSAVVEGGEGRGTHHVAERGERLGLVVVEVGGRVEVKVDGGELLRAGEEGVGVGERGAEWLIWLVGGHGGGRLAGEG